MKIPNAIVSLLGVLLVLTILPFLVLSNVNLFMTPQFVYYEYGKSDFPPSSRYDPPARTLLATKTVLYTRGDLNDADLKNLHVYNDRELSHMSDVQVLATRAFAVNYTLGVLIVLTIIALWRAGLVAHAARSVFNGALLTLAIFGALGLFALVAFNTFFVAFHRIFFVGDSWMFAYNDSLIQFYPQPLWVDASLGIVIFTVLEALLVLGITFRVMQQPTTQKMRGIFTRFSHVPDKMIVENTKETK